MFDEWCFRTVLKKDGDSLIIRVPPDFKRVTKNDAGEDVEVIIKYKIKE